MCRTSQVAGTYGAGPVQQYTPTQGGGHAPGQVAGAHGHAPTQGGGPKQALPGHEGHGHDSILYQLADRPPHSGQFITGSLGADAGKDFKLDKGAGFKGRKGRDPNGNDQKQNNLKKADANRPAYGIPSKVAGTNEKPNYVQDIQVSIGMGALESLRPDVLQSLIAKQNAGQGSVWNGVAYMTGLIDQHDGSVSPEFEAQRSQVMQTAVGKSGKTIAQWAENPKDQNGTNWARSNHSMTGVKTYLQLESQGIPTKVALDLANNDDLVSGAGRIDQIAPGRASNNQENTFTGMNGAERKEWAKAAKYARELNRPDLLRTLMDSHTMGSHMLTQFGNKGAESKINKNLGLDPNLPADQRKAILVNYFLNNAKDPKKGDTPKGDLSPGQVGQRPSAPTQASAPAPAHSPGGGAGAPDVAAGGGCAHDPTQGASLVGGGPEGMGSITAVLQQLISAINALVQSLGATGVAGANGGGPTKQPGQVAQAAQQAPAMAGHAH